MANHNITRSEVHQRLHVWLKQNQPFYGDLYITEENFSPEGIVLDKAKPQVPGKPGKKKSKDWWIEFKWKSRLHFEEGTPSYQRAFAIYKTDWQRSTFGAKHTSLQGAMDSFKTHEKNNYWRNHLKMEGKHFRIRNVISGEIYLLLEEQTT